MTDQQYNADNARRLEGADAIFTDAFDSPPTNSPLDQALYAYIETMLSGARDHELAMKKMEIVKHCEANAHHTKESRADLHISNIQESYAKLMPETQGRRSL